MRAWTKGIMITVMLLAGSQAMAQRWESLGSCTVKKRAERDVINVTIAEGRFSKLKLKVRNNGLKIMDLKVHFGDGSVQDVPMRKFINAGGESRIIDLQGRKRVIKKVVFTYKTADQKRRSGRAMVSLWGRH